MNALFLFLVLTTSTLVLRSGDRIDVDGPVREENGVVTFRSGGLLYSMPAVEVDIAATQKASDEVEEKAEEEEVRPLRVSAEERKRLLAELEKNHSGKPGPTPRPHDEIIPAPSRAEAAEQSREEWAWRREARAYEESVRRAKEELELLESRAEELRTQIVSFVSLGYKPSQFTYQSTQLEHVLAKIPAAKLAVKRAERELVQFREDARRQGILPGWLR